MIIRQNRFVMSPLGGFLMSPLGARWETGLPCGSCPATTPRRLVVVVSGMTVCGAEGECIAYAKAGPDTIVKWIQHSTVDPNRTWTLTQARPFHPHDCIWLQWVPCEAEWNQYYSDDEDCSGPVVVTREWRWWRVMVIRYESVAYFQMRLCLANQSGGRDMFARSQPPPDAPKCVEGVYPSPYSCPDYTNGYAGGVATVTEA